MPIREDDASKASFTTPAAIFSEVPKAFEDPCARWCFRVLRMVAILHGKGFQALRVYPHEYPIAYRIELFPAAYADETGARYRRKNHLSVNSPSQEKALVAGHSGANDTKFFGWEDAEGLNAHQLAIRFIERYPLLARASYHLDFAYAGWYATLLAHCEYGFLPYLLSEYEDVTDAMRLRRFGQWDMKLFPLPPLPPANLQLNPEPKPQWLEGE
jgi:hypothetical protein